MRFLSLTAVVVCLGAPAIASSGETPPGFSAEEPASGPRVRVDSGWLVPYEERIPGTDVVFRMTPIPAGDVTIGSPSDEADREDDEGPRVDVRVSAMWVGVCEVTWAEYRAYMDLYTPLKQLGELRYRLASNGHVDADGGAPDAALVEYLQIPDGVDAVTCPTPLYDASFTYEPGEDPKQPAVTMTQFAAKQYTKWLSGVTGRDYRLPTEAEWEYFARAGSETAYSFGDDPEQLSEHAWWYDNSEDETHFVGLKTPNAWGLHDVHGNAAEWVLDQYDAEHYAKLASEAAQGQRLDAHAAIRRADAIWPRAYRGGCWYDDPEALRSAARAGSVDDEWTLSDPNLPISPWWYTEYESQGVGMRIVRPHAPMDAAMKELAWEADVEDLRLDVEDRLAEGRGVQAAASRKLPLALEQLPAALERTNASDE